MTNLNELHRYSGKNREFWLHHTYGRWTCAIKVDEDGTKLEVSATGKLPEDAYQEASAKYDRLLQRGAPELAARQIEYDPVDELPTPEQPPTPVHRPLAPEDDDEVPF